MVIFEELFFIRLGIQALGPYSSAEFFVYADFKERGEIVAVLWQAGAEGRVASFPEILYQKIVALGFELIELFTFL